MIISNRLGAVALPGGGRARPGQPYRPDELPKDVGFFVKLRDMHNKNGRYRPAECGVGLNAMPEPQRKQAFVARVRFGEVFGLVVGGGIGAAVGTAIGGVGGGIAGGLLAGAAGTTFCGWLDTIDDTG